MLQKFQRENIKSFSPSPAATAEFQAYTHSLMKRLVWSSPCSGWFKGGRKEGPVTAIWAGSRLHYYETLREVRWEDYELEYWTKNRFQYLGNGYTERELEEGGDVTWYFDDEFVRA
jgi:hypothetical protein